jgi:hypothetical protein
MKNYVRGKNRVLVARPLGGLNDVLCQIEYARKIAARTHRRLAIQTETGNKDLAHKFGQSFGSIFSFIDGTSLPSQIELENLLSRSRTVFPEFFDSPERLLEGSLEDITKGQTSRYQLTPGGHESFDVLVHESWGGGSLGTRLLKRIELNEKFLLKLERALATLPEKATGFHFRNTDLKSDRERLNDAIRRTGKTGPIVIASDDSSVKAFLEKENPSRQILSAAELIRSDHKLTKTEMAIAQLFVLAMCDHLVIVPLAKGEPVSYSGYGQLAKAIWSVRKLNTEGLVAFVFSVTKFFEFKPRFDIESFLRSIVVSVLISDQSLKPKGLYKQLIDLSRRL